ncbi:uncharacterized protein LOC131256612 isoform X2 [Magnolia sinica]|nr:uncharacterized protein LOC131256612 isoform X2 [Magnolia sinica]
MYSKANSEAEYMDLKTLWERTNDAINTIIRRDESSESGELLQPCIEAALNLGCIPRRASRSQRHNNPRCYLSSTAQEATQMSVAPKNSETVQYDGSSRLLPPRFGIPVPNSSSQFGSYYPSLVTPTNVNSTHLGSDSCSPILQDKTTPHEQMNHPPMSSCEFPLLPENFAISWQDKSFPMDSSPRLGGVYPLSYSTNHQMVESGFAFQYPQGSNSDAIMVSMPHVQPIPEAETGFLQNLLSGNNALDASNRPASGSLNLESTSENPPDMGYDLSLRLGPLPTPCLSVENSPTHEDAGSSSRDRSRLCDPSLSRMKTGHFDCSSSSPTQRDQRFCFFPGESSRTPWSAAQVNGVSRGKI